jgi:hypothetical protein
MLEVNKTYKLSKTRKRHVKSTSILTYIQLYANSSISTVLLFTL